MNKINKYRILTFLSYSPILQPSLSQFIYNLKGVNVIKKYHSFQHFEMQVLLLLLLLQL